MTSSSSSIQEPTVSSLIWAQLLRPLPLIDCIKLEHVSKSFRDTIYSGQHRFVWNQKFQDFIYRKYGINRTQYNVDDFLTGIAPKIGPHCRQLILKFYVLPINDIFQKFIKLQSLYLQVRCTKFRNNCFN